MRELLRRLRSSPVLGSELLLSTLLTTILGLANTLFVMLVFNRFIPYGVDATLVTLTVGVLLATLFDLGIKVARRRIAAVITSEPNTAGGELAFAAMIRTRMGALDRMPGPRRMEVLRGLSVVERTLSPETLTAMIEVPFSILVVVVIGIVEPLLALIVLAFAVAAFVISYLGREALAAPTREVNDTEPRLQALITAASRDADSIRCFNAGPFLMTAWRQARLRLTDLRAGISGRQGSTQNMLSWLSSMQSILIITVGSLLVVKGSISMGALVGANMLASRAFAPIIRLAQTGEALVQADDALKRLRDFIALPQELRQGSALNRYRGGLEFIDAAYAYPQSPAPLFEHLSMRLEPGQVLVVTGHNGSGKTTLARLLAGLIEPIRGQVLVDGTELRQIVPKWWRHQLVYLPQEPVLFDGTVAENIRVNAPNLDDAGLAHVVAIAGLTQWLDSTREGLATPMSESGKTLAIGLRKRIALARAIAGGGNLAIFDEPTEGMDREGRAAIARALDSLVRRGATAVILTHEPDKVSGGHLLLDLGSKPIPTLTSLPSQPVRRGSNDT